MSYVIRELNSNNNEKPLYTSEWLNPKYRQYQMLARIKRLFIAGGDAKFGRQLAFLAHKTKRNSYHMIQHSHSPVFTQMK